MDSLQRAAASATALALIHFLNAELLKAPRCFYLCPVAVVRGIFRQLI
jgi:hypothetical protein